MNYVNNNENVKLLFSQVQKFSGQYNSSKKYNAYPPSRPLNLMDPDFSAKDQYNRLLLSDRITYTPSMFVNKKTFQSVGGYDEEIYFVEDYPMWLKLTKAGIKLHFMEKITVAYRQHEESLNSHFEKAIFNKQYLRTEAMKEKYVYPNLPIDIVLNMKYKYLISKYFNILGINRNTLYLNKLYNLFTIYLNPFQYVYSFKKHILNLKKSNIFYVN